MYKLGLASSTTFYFWVWIFFLNFSLIEFIRSWMFIKFTKYFIFDVPQLFWKVSIFHES